MRVAAVVLLLGVCSFGTSLPTKPLNELIQSGSKLWPFGSSERDPDDDIDMMGIVQERGYPIERHWTTTQDGYVLQMFRIPHGAKKGENVQQQPATKTRPVVLLQHCLLCSSFDFVNNMNDQSLAFILADSGCDVWLGNNRGNTYSRNHTFLSTDSVEFWDFTWDEMAEYDVPAEIDYVLMQTEQPSLTYIGHSQGTTQGFAAFSTNSKLASRVNMFVALAPVAFVGHSRSPMLNLLSKLDVLEAFKNFGQKEFLPHGSFATSIAHALCETTPSGCNQIMLLFSGPAHINTTRIPVYTAHTPAGTSVKNMIHWSQQHKRDTFAMFDYGSAEKNMHKYKSATAPTYDLSNMHVPLIMYVGGNDVLTDSQDLDRLRTLLPEGVVVKETSKDSWAHLDFLWTSEGHAMFEDIAQIIQAKFSSASETHAAKTDDTKAFKSQLTDKTTEPHN